MASQEDTPRFPILRTLLPEDGKTFPSRVEVIAGKTLAKTGRWWKAVLLVVVGRKVQLRFYGWQKNREGQFKQRQKFNVSPARYLGDVIRVLTIYLRESGRMLKSEDWYSNVLKELFELRKERKHSLHLLQQSRLKKFKNSISEFQVLLRKGASEKEFQRFLKKNYWIFGTQYVRVLPQARAGLKSRTDFLVQRYDGFYDVVELKDPKFELFVKENWSNSVKNAVSQMMRYIHHFDKNFQYLADETGLRVFLPKGYIVIGRTREKERDILKIHNTFLNRIEILTYDDLLEIAKLAIKTYEKNLRTRCLPFHNFNEFIRLCYNLTALLTL